MTLVYQGMHLVPSALSSSGHLSTGCLAIGVHVMLREHVVGNRILLPGVGYVELAFAAMIRGGASKTMSLVGILFVRPCVVGSDAQAVE